LNGCYPPNHKQDIAQINQRYNNTLKTSLTKDVNSKSIR